MAVLKSALKIENTEDVTHILNLQLADTIDLYSQLKLAHWNVKGNNFYSLHQLFDDLGNDVLGFIDTIAERIASIGGVAKGGLSDVTKASRLTPLSNTNKGQLNLLKQLSIAYGNLCQTSRDAIKLIENLEDTASADLMTEVTRGLDKGLWLLESHLH
ncbi:DNA starvation/stationary phase protection protein Dps [Algibacter sp. AS12]|uniref:DNA starvation/stationary phase protection protein Dps n=1 Tax=Algibacter sp. AS12 TaxID=3135773 RepID=UPI00398B4274